MKKSLTLLFTILLLTIFITPAIAEVKIGGIIFTDFYYLNRDKENAQDWGLTDGSTSYDVTAIQVPNITRLYTKWTNEDNVGMYIEMGLGKDSGNVSRGNEDGVELRHAYGWWEINSDLKLTVGKTTTPFSPLNPNQLLGTRSGSYNIIGAGFGDLYPSRMVQVRGTYTFNRNISVELALVDPNGVADIVYNKSPWDWEEKYTTKIPRIDIGVPIKLDWANLYPSFMWQKRTMDSEEVTNDEIITYIASLGLKTGYGPVSFSAEGNYGENWGSTGGFMGFTYPAIFSSAGYRDGEVYDAESYSFWIDLSYQIGPFTPHLIYGEMETENAYWDMDFSSKSMMYGVSCPIDMATGFRIRPELMFYDEGTVEVRGSEYQDYEAGKYYIAGVQFQITF